MKKKRWSPYPNLPYCADETSRIDASQWVHDRTIQLLGPDELGEVSDNIRVLQIGSGSGERDTGFYTDEIHKFLDKPNVHAVLVEPNPVSFSRLKQNLQSRYGSLDRFTLVNKAVCPDQSPALPLKRCCMYQDGCKGEDPCSVIGRGGDLPFHIVSERLLQEHPNAPKWGPYHLGNADRKNVLKFHKQLGLSQQELSQYVEKIQVKCLNVRKLLEEHVHVNAKDFDLFDVAIEGFSPYIFADWIVLGGRNSVGIILERNLRPTELWTFYTTFGRNHFCVDEHKGSNLVFGYQNWQESAAFKLARDEKNAWKKNMIQDKIKLLADDTSKKLHFLQVGACDGDFNHKTSNDPVQRVIYQSHITAALVEPNPPMFKKLQENVHSFFGDTPRIRAFNMAVCPDKSGTVSFYVVKPQFAVDYPWKPHWAKFQLSSMNRAHLLKMGGDVGLEEKVWSGYIEALQVPCKKPADMLETAGLSSNQVDLLQVDAEGYDAKIIHAFLQLEDFDPQIIIFEQVHLVEKELPALVAKLRSRDYHVFDGLKGNTLAIKPHLDGGKSGRR